MESNELKKQKRLGPAPIASFEKSFEDNTLLQRNISPTYFDNNTNFLTGGSSNGFQLHNKHMDGKVGQYCQKNLDIGVNYQQQQQAISVSDSTQPKKLHGIGKKISLQAVSDGDSDGGVVVENEIKIMTSETKVLTLGLKMSSTPRIDISRASSSSHHDSRDSSPENVFEQVGTGTLQETIGIGFREEGTLDLRSSTEELYFMDPEQKKEEQEKMQQSRKSPVIFKFDEHQTYLQQHQRKDSASSEVAALLCISGRTSRISSVGSQGSAISRLSVISGVSRSPSPHRMLLETSFCGPKPLESVVDGSVITTVEQPTAEALEQILLSRKHDPTQAVLAEGIHIETPRVQQKKVFKDTSKIELSSSGTEKISKILSTSAYKTSSVSSNRKNSSKMSTNDSGKQVVGVTPSGTEYIRIKLKPDHMYEDYGLGPNERIVDISEASSAVMQKKPATLSLGRDIRMTEQRLTPSSSPKLNRHAVLVKDIVESRSPSPATATISRKSSFCSLFKTKDSPDSPRDCSRSRSKSRDRLTPQSQTETPSKQKSVLAIFKPKRSGSKSKCSSPVDQEALSQLDGISQVEFKFKSDSNQDQLSRSSSRLKYYDTPLDGKSIHIPLHTPPEEKHDQQFTTSKGKHQQQPLSFSIESLTKSISKIEVRDQAPILPPKFPKPLQFDKLQKIENLGTVHNLLEDVHEKERTWSLEVQRHSSQENPEIGSETSTEQKLSKPTPTDVESQIIKNGTASTISQVNVPSTITQVTTKLESPKKEKRRLLFATKLGSGSEEQIFSTQFSLSKTESLSSQLSEQTIPESPAFEGKESLHRTDTVIRRVEESSFTTAIVTKKQKISGKNKQNDCILYDSDLKNQKQEFGKDSQMKSKSIFEQEDKKKKSVVVTMRKKDSLEDVKWKSKSEDDDHTQRHSRYVENFDIKKKFQDNTTKTMQSKKNSASSIKEIDCFISSREKHDKNTRSSVPITTPKSKHSDLISTLSQSLTERQSVISTDEPIESSESEGDSEMDPNRIKRHLTRHIGVIEDHESAGLVSQDSFEDELPYVPTTLPEERAHGVSLIPMKERVNMELKMYSVDRPRSTTPMNPACLEEYCGIVTPDDVEYVPIRGEKLRISLPRKDPTKDRTKTTKSPRRISNDSSKSWFEFAEQGIKSQQQTSNPSIITTKKQHQDLDEKQIPLHNEEPPPLPPRKLSGATINQWINFENIPEKRKPPKRITALPKESPQELSKIQSLPPTIHYNYVKPEECQCECHEIERESTTHNTITNLDLLQQGEDMQPLLEPEPQEGIDPSDSSLDYDAGGPDIQDTKT